MSGSADLWDTESGHAPRSTPRARRAASYDRLTHAQLARELGITAHQLTKLVARNGWLGLTPSTATSHTTYDREAVERIKLLRRVPLRTRRSTSWLSDYQKG